MGGLFKFMANVIKSCQIALEHLSVALPKDEAACSNRASQLQEFAERNCHADASGSDEDIATCFVNNGPSFLRIVKGGSASVSLHDGVFSIINPFWSSLHPVCIYDVWGNKNFEMVKSDDSSSPVLRVHYPKGSGDPETAKKEGTPLGGGGFHVLFKQPATHIRLTYFVRFADRFDFVLGGKLPGLYGGMVHSGGRIPDGTNGFSTRYMWRKKGDGEIYAYLPTSITWGTSIGRGNWRFLPNKWYKLEQQITLNSVGQTNGQIQVWVDDKLVVDEKNLLFRTTDKLLIDGIIFSSFFGGEGLEWITPNSTYADFIGFTVDHSMR